MYIKIGFVWFDFLTRLNINQTKLVTIYKNLKPIIIDLELVWFGLN